MNIFGRAKKRGELMLVFDLRSSSVGAALFWTEESGIPKIIYTVREPIEVIEAVEAERFFDSTLKSLDAVANKVYKSGLGAPKRIFCILASPWYVSQTRILSVTEEEPFIFTSKLADDLIQKEILRFEEEHLSTYVKASQKIRPIELKNLKTMLNGYETSTPLNQKAQELEMTMYLSMSPEQVLSQIENTISKFFHYKNIKFASFLMSTFVVTRDMFPKEGNFLLIDIGAEMTDISMTKKNILHESISFPLGHNMLTRGLANDLNISLGEAESFLSLFVAGHADTNVALKLAPIIDKLKALWLKNFQESLANLSKDVFIPATIYLSVEPDFVDLFGKTIETEQFNQYTLTESKFKIIVLNMETLHNIVEFETETLRDPYLVTESVYINHFLV